MLLELSSVQPINAIDVYLNLVCVGQNPSYVVQSRSMHEAVSGTILTSPHTVSSILSSNHHVHLHPVLNCVFSDTQRFDL
jgi:hypothetical protein